MFSPSKYLEMFLATATPSFVTDVFIVAIVMTLVVALNQARKGTHSRFLEHASGIMTSLGILGTFIGIVIGLLHFNPSEIDASISQLLEGLKTAFSTSLAGMFCAISFRFMDLWWFAQKREQNGVKETITPEDIHSAITSQSNHLVEVRDALIGNEEGSLSGQVKLLRTDISDFQKTSNLEKVKFNERLWTELQTFAEMMSKSATEQVIEALKEVIVDFNNNLTEQFGENFKALDESVKKLVDWQQQYKGQVEQMSDQYQQSVDSLVDTRTAVAGIWEECKGIPMAMSELKTVIEVNQHQIQELNRHLETFALMRDRAVEAVPQINQQLDEIGVQLKAGASQMKEVMLEGAVEFKESVNNTNVAMTDMAHSVSNNSEEMAQSLKDTSSQLNDTVRDMLSRLETSATSLQTDLDNSVTTVLQTLRQGTERTLSGVDQQIQDAVSRTGEGVNKQITILDEAVQRENQRVMNEMGRALTTITGRFTEDYQRLVQAMQTIVSDPQR